MVEPRLSAQRSPPPCRGRPFICPASQQCPRLPMKNSAPALADRMKGKFDFARALVLVALLPGDLDRGKPGLSSVDEIHTHRG